MVFKGVDKWVFVISEVGFWRLEISFWMWFVFFNYLIVVLVEDMKVILLNMMKL